MKSIRTTLAALAAGAVLLAVTGCTLGPSNPDALPTGRAQDLPQARQILERWAEASPTNNEGTSTIKTAHARDGRWAAYLTPADTSGGDPADENFQCVAITSVRPTAFIYSDYTDNWFGDKLLGVRRTGACATTDDLDLPAPPSRSDDLRNDWAALIADLNAHRESPYATITSRSTPAATYRVLNSTVVSTTETRFTVAQVPTTPTVLLASITPTTSTIIVPLTGPVTVTADPPQHR